MKPSAIRWVSANASGVHRDASASAPDHARRIPAITPNQGAARKKR
jgi:hypothetical protein